MNTIYINMEEQKRILKYESDYYFEDFIYDDFKVVVSKEDYKIVYLVHKNNDITKLTVIMTKNGIQKQIKLKFKETKETYEIVEILKCDFLDIFVKNACKDGMSEDEARKQVVEFIKVEVLFIMALKQYIMNESYKRKVAIKESKTKTETVNNYSEKDKKKKVKDTEVCYLLNDIIRYISCSKTEHHYITCPCWTVRGHFRHYNNGIIKWISSYEKGKQRNTGKVTKDKIYKI